MMQLVSLGPLSRSFRRAQLLHRQFERASDKAGFIEEYQDRALKRVLAGARTSRHYRDLVVEKRSDLARIPPISKHEVIDRPGDFRTDARPCNVVTTGGSSGETLTLFMHRSRRGAEWYWISRIWSEVGFDRRRSVRAVLRNHMVPKGLDVLPLTKEVVFDNFNLTDQYIDEISKVIGDHKIEFVHAYPSAASSLVRRWLDRSFRPSSLKAFLCGSEFVYPSHRELVEGMLGVKLISWYGHTEKLVLAGEHADCANYHANPFYGYVEFLDPEGADVRVPGEVGEIVSTGFVNPSMALLRYRTGDLAEYLGEACPGCGRLGRTFRMKSGRSGEWIYRSDGTRVSTTALNLHDSYLAQIHHMQLVQPENGVVEALVVPGPGFDSATLRAVVSALEARLGNGISVGARTIAAPVLGKNGKAQLLIRRPLS